MSVLNGLEKLHDLHLKLKAVQDELDRGPRLIKAKEAAQSKKQAELDEIKHRHTEQRKLADSKNLQLKTSEAKLADLRMKLNMCGTNREFDILKGQIAADEMAKSVFEDEILDCLEQADRLKQQIADAEKGLADAKEEVKKAAAQVAATKASLDDQAATLRVAVSEAEVVVVEDLRLQYRRMVAANGADSLAAVDKGVCTGCYVTLSPQQTVSIRSGKMFFCECGRLLYNKPSE